MQLSDVIWSTDAVGEAISDEKFNNYLKRLSKLPTWKKKEIEESIMGHEARISFKISHAL